MEGAKVKIEDVLNAEITVVGGRVRKSRYDKNNSGKYLAVQFEDGSGEIKVFFTGSDVLIEQMEKYQNEIPFVAVIKKIDRYYTFT